MTARIPPEIDRGDTRIAVAGDWHGNQRWAVKMVDLVGAAGIRTLLHVGDFGLFRAPYSKTYLNTLEKAAGAADVMIWITDGNHEDHDWRLELEAVNGGRPAKIRPHIWLLPRGHRWSHAGRSFLSFGGAPSIDFMWRGKGSWWASEVVTEQDIDRAIAGGPADIMIAHDAPAPATRAVDSIRASNPMGFPWKALSYAATGTAAMTRAYDGVKPKLFFHGHYHVHDFASVEGRRILSLNKDDGPGNIMTLDLLSLEVAWLEGSDVPRVRKAISWEKEYTSPTAS